VGGGYRRVLAVAADGAGGVAPLAQALVVKTVVAHLQYRQYKRHNQEHCRRYGFRHCHAVPGRAAVGAWAGKQQQVQSG
jgi:hypothetical protein